MPFETRYLERRKLLLLDNVDQDQTARSVQSDLDLQCP